MTILENLIKKLTTKKNNNIKIYLFTIQYTNNIISIIKIIITKITKNINIFTINNKNKNTQLKFKTTKQIKKILKKYKTITTFKTKTIKKINTQNNKINHKHYIKILLFNYTKNKILKNQSKINNIFNDKNIQIKSSLISFNEKGKNNGTSAATIVKKTA